VQTTAPAKNKQIHPANIFALMYTTKPFGFTKFKGNTHAVRGICPANNACQLMNKCVPPMSVDSLSGDFAALEM